MKKISNTLVQLSGSLASTSENQAQALETKCQMPINEMVARKVGDALHVPDVADEDGTKNCLQDP